MIDGDHVTEHLCVVALEIDAQVVVTGARSHPCVPLPCGPHHGAGQPEVGRRFLEHLSVAIPSVLANAVNHIEPSQCHLSGRGGALIDRANDGHAGVRHALTPQSRCRRAHVAQRTETDVIRANVCIACHWSQWSISTSAINVLAFARTCRYCNACHRQVPTRIFSHTCRAG